MKREWAFCGRRIVTVAKGAERFETDGHRHAIEWRKWKVTGFPNLTGDAKSVALS